MNGKQRMAIAGAGLVVTGVGLSVIGAVLITPAAVAWAAGLVEKGTERLLAEVERASKTVGTAAGTLQRSFSEATRVGMAEIRRKGSEEGHYTKAN